MKQKLLVLVEAVLFLLLGITSIFCEELGGFAVDANGNVVAEFNTSREMEAWANSHLPEGLTLGDGSPVPEISAQPNTTQQAEQPTPPTAPSTSLSAKPCTHHYTVEIIKEPTCAEEGEVKYTCDKCGDSYTDVAPATGEHSYIEEVTKEATCTEDGERVFTCSVCGDSYSEKIDALGHNYIESVTTEPTCTEVGIKTFTCDRCGDSYTEEIPAKGHVSDDGVVVKEASLFFDGLKEYHCTECGELLKSEVLPSQYPAYCLYIIIGVGCAVVIGAVIAIVLKKRR